MPKVPSVLPKTTVVPAAAPRVTVAADPLAPYATFWGADVSGSPYAPTGPIPPWQGFFDLSGRKRFPGAHPRNRGAFLRRATRTAASAFLTRFAVTTMQTLIPAFAPQWKTMFFSGIGTYALGRGVDSDLLEDVGFGIIAASSLSAVHKAEDYYEALVDASERALQALTDPVYAGTGAYRGALDDLRDVLVYGGGPSTVPIQSALFDPPYTHSQLLEIYRNNPARVASEYISRSRLMDMVYSTVGGGF